MGHSNSKHSKYGYKKAHVFTPTLGYLLLCETANTFLYKSAHIIYSDTGTHAKQ